MELTRKVQQRVLMALVRPYVYRELPGWGKLYNLIGAHERNEFWVGAPVRWVSGKLHGYEMRLDLSGWSNRSAYFLGRFYDLPTQLALRQLITSGDTVVDIGGNEGMMSLLMARLVGSEGRVIAFEPNPGPRAVFEQNIGRNNISNIDLRPCGLSDEAINMPLFVPDINWGEGSFSARRHKDGHYVDAAIEIGDSALAGLSPTVIKIDVEGFEHRVIRGLAGTLRSSRPAILMEMSEELFGYAGTCAAEVAETMRSFGYSAKRMSLKGRFDLHLTPISDFHDWHSGDVLWQPS